MIPVLLALALTAASEAPVDMGPPDFVTQPVWRERPTSGDLTDFYPVGANGAAGSVVVECTANARGALEHCHSIRELPAGLDFDKAAVALVLRKYAIGPKDAAGRDVAGRPVRIPVEWSVRTSAAVAPPAGSDLITRPQWAARPSGDVLARVYPRGALSRGEGGRATLNCTVKANGYLENCTVVEEEGEGFGQAALAASPYFRMKPQMADGKPVGGGTVRIPLVWRAPTY